MNSMMDDIMMPVDQQSTDEIANIKLLPLDIESGDDKNKIKFFLLLKLSLKNLLYKKLRTSLTTLGVVIGIGAVVFLISFGYGLQNLVNKQIIGSSSIDSIDVTTAHPDTLSFSADRISQIKSVPDVAAVGELYSAAGHINLNGSSGDAVVFGVDQTYLNLKSQQFAAGKQLDATSNKEILLSSSLLKTIGFTNPQKAIGQSVDLHFSVSTTSDSQQNVTRSLVIKGVTDSNAGSETYVSKNLFIDNGAPSATAIKIVVKDKNYVSAVRKSVDAIGYSTNSPLDSLSQVNQIFSFLKLALLGFGGIGIIIAILGMFNTLTISLLERTREIALMITLGARRRDMRRLFIVEALLLSAFGGFVGIVGAFILGQVGNFFINSFAHSRGVVGRVSAFDLSLWLVFFSLSVSAIIGLLVVYYPAKRAAEIDPVNALYNE